MKKLNLEIIAPFGGDAKNKGVPFVLYSLITLLLFSANPSFGQGPIESNLKNVLIWYKPSGHSNTVNINDWIANIGVQNGFTVDATTDPTDFTSQNLRSYDVIYSVNGDFFGRQFSAAGRTAVEDFYSSGKGLGCLHQCNRGEQAWTWYMNLMECRYENHAGNQPGDIVADIEGEGHDARGSMLATGETYNYQEEWYNQSCNPRSMEGVKIMWTLDESSLASGGGTLGNDHPMAWTRDFGGGRYFMNMGGHNDNIMTSDLFKDHIYGSLKYLAGYSGCMDPKYAEYNAKATNQPAGACVDLAVLGCMDPLYEEYDPAANVQPDGACVNIKVSISKFNQKHNSVIISNLKINISGSGPHEAIITNARGIQVFSAQGNDSKIYVPKNIEKGIYFVKVTTPFQILSKRVILF